MSRKIPKKYSKVLARDEGICQLCFTPISASPIEWSNSLLGGPTIDHIIPQAWGGPDSLWNLRLTHARCNTKRASKVVYPREHYAIAANLYHLHGGEFHTRWKDAVDILEGYRVYKRLHRKNRKGIPFGIDDIPVAVRKLQSGIYPFTD